MRWSNVRNISLLVHNEEPSLSSDFEFVVVSLVVKTSVFNLLDWHGQ